MFSILECNDTFAVKYCWIFGSSKSIILFKQKIVSYFERISNVYSSHHNQSTFFVEALHESYAQFFLKLKQGKRKKT